MKRFVSGTIFLLVVAVFAPSTRSEPASDKIVWKPIPQVVLRVDDAPPKVWNIYRTGKKADPLLLQLGTRFLVIYIHNEEVYELKPNDIDHKGQDLWWREADRPEKPIPTSDWSTRDVGSAWRIRLKLAGEGRMVDIQIPQLPDLRGLY